MAELDKNGADMTIEETFAALDDLIGRLEGGKGSLEDAFKNYEEGMRLVKSCNEKIEKIEKQIMVLGGGPGGGRGRWNAVLKNYWNRKRRRQRRRCMRTCRRKRASRRRSSRP